MSNVKWSSTIPGTAGLYWCRIDGGEPEPCRVTVEHRPPVHGGAAYTAYACIGADSDEDNDQHAAVWERMEFGPRVLSLELAVEAAEVVHATHDNSEFGDYYDLCKKLDEAGYPYVEEP